MKLTEAEAAAEMSRMFMVKGRNPDPDPRETPVVQKANAAQFQRDLIAARYDPTEKFDSKAAVKLAREQMKYGR